MSSKTTQSARGAPAVPLETEVERRVGGWIEPYNQAWRMVRARDWAAYLGPQASLEVRLATVSHNNEQMFPNGPRVDKAHGRRDDPHFLYAHASRSAEVVGVWLHGQDDVEDVELPESQRLITLHEFGGLDGADIVQAGGSVSFLETLVDAAPGWVSEGECSAEQARRKHGYMAERIRISKARRLAEPLLEHALASLGDI